MSLPGHVEESMSVAAVLTDPVRRRLYFHVRAAARPVTRDEAAAAVGVSRELAAFHLEKLLVSGLLDTAPYDDEPRPEGRPPKRYRVTDAAVRLDIPPRQYDLIAAILLEAVCEGGRAPAEAARRIAHRRGLELGAEVRGTVRAGRMGRDRAARVVAAAVLAEQGYEPDAAQRPTRIRLRNCPFHGLMDARDPRLVCRINQSLIDGILTGLQITALGAVLEALPGECCVAVRELPPAGG